MPGPGSTLGHDNGFVDQWVEAARRRARLQFGALVSVMAASAASLAVLASQARPIPTDPVVSAPKRENPSPTVRVELATAPIRSDPAPRVSAPPPSTASVRRHSMLGPSNTASQPLASRTPANPSPVVPPKEKPPADPVALGRELFARRWKPNDPRSHGGDGLGPVYNADSCLACHFLGGPGGAGPVEANVTVILAEKGVGDYIGDFVRPTSEFDGVTIRRPVEGRSEWERIVPRLREARGLVIHNFGSDPAYVARRTALLELADDPTLGEAHGFPDHCKEMLAQFNTPPLFGLGLIDALPDEVLLLAAKRPLARNTRGHVRRLKEGRIGRFGWRAQAASLDDFVRGACANELGLEVPGQTQASPIVGPTVRPRNLDLDRAECEALTAYIAQLPAPIEQPWTGSSVHEDIERGRRAFQAIGCTNCHRPSLGGIQGIYSDLLLHEMGDDSSASSYGGEPRKSPNDPSDLVERGWRTPPLWGLAASAPYMHDGGAPTIEQAIAQHGGQGALAAQEFSNLPTATRRRILVFLNSLTPPPPDPLVSVESPDCTLAHAADPSIARWRRGLEERARWVEQSLTAAARNVLKAKVEIARKYEKMGRIALALENYHTVADEHPDSVEARFARERIATLERK